MIEKLVKYLYIILLFLPIGFSGSIQISLAQTHETTPEWSFSGRFERVAISGDGNYIIAGGHYVITHGGPGGQARGEVFFFEKNSNLSLWSFEWTSYNGTVGIGDGLSSLSISYNGTYMCLGTSMYIRLFRKNSATPLWSYQFTPPDGVTADWVFTEMSKDGSRIIVAVATHYELSEIYMFDVGSAVPRYKTTLPERVESLSVSADAAYFTVTTAEWLDSDNKRDKLYLFSWEEKQLLWSYTAGISKYLYEAVAGISGDGRYIMYCADTLHKGDIREVMYLFSRDSPEPIWRHFGLAPDETGIHVEFDAISLSFNGSRAIAGRTLGRTFFFRSDTNETSNTFVKSGPWVAMSDDGNCAMAAGPLPDSVHVFMLADEGFERYWSYYFPEDYNVLEGDMSSDGRYIVVATKPALFLFDNTKVRPLGHSLLEQPWFWAVTVVGGVAIATVVLLFALRKRLGLKVRERVKQKSTI